jgi:gluconolactonase
MKFRLRAQDFRFVGQGLSRPECVLAGADGTLWVSDNRASVMRIAPDGSQRLLGPATGLPNGLAMDRNGVLYIADIGAGALYRLFPDGRHELVLDRLDGRRLSAVNFVYLDARDRLWITLSTRTEPRLLAVETPTPDGYILLSDPSGVRIVADGICFTNEVRIDKDQLYIAETALGRVLRRRIAPDGSLGAPAVFGPAPLFPGAKIDGICLDAAGNLWVTEVTRNAILVISPEGEASTVFDDPERRILNFPTSIAFGGADRRTAYIGSLHMDRLACFQAPFPGQRMRHWPD